MEIEADKILLNMKQKAIQRGIQNSASYAPSMHFFHAKPLIDQDPIFKIIQKLPKGGLLHLHSTAGVSSEWVIKNLTYRDDVLICNHRDGFNMFVAVYESLINSNYYFLTLFNYLKSIFALCE